MTGSQPSCRLYSSVAKSQVCDPLTSHPSTTQDNVCLSVCLSSSHMTSTLPPALPRPPDTFPSHTGVAVATNCYTAQSIPACISKMEVCDKFRVVWWPWLNWRYVATVKDGWGCRVCGMMLSAEENWSVDQYLVFITTVSNTTSLITNKMAVTFNLLTTSHLQACKRCM